MADDYINIYSAAPGTVVALTGDAVPVTFSVDGNAGLFNDLMAIVTTVGISGQGGFQFMHALREFIYVYVFTERVGEIVVGGVAFPYACNIGPQGTQGPQGSQGPDGPMCISGITGLERILTWYECNRITTRATPVTITFGTTVSYTAFLTAVKADIVNADTGVAQFSFRFNYIPNISDDDSYCFPIEDCLDPPCS